MLKLISLSLLLALSLNSTPAIASTPIPTSPSTRVQWDMTAFDDWCGEPNGTIRVVPAFVSAPDTLQDDYGNLWGYSPEEPLEEGSLYILWLDDMGTTAIEDDEILKVFKEVY